jgi:hypothetical protein
MFSVSVDINGSPFTQDDPYLWETHPALAMPEPYPLPCDTLTNCLTIIPSITGPPASGPTTDIDFQYPADLMAYIGNQPVGWDLRLTSEKTRMWRMLDADPSMSPPPISTSTLFRLEDVSFLLEVGGHGFCLDSTMALLENVFGGHMAVSDPALRATSTFPRPSLSDTLYFFQIFELSSSGVLELFNHAYAMQRLGLWAQEGMGSKLEPEYRNDFRQAIPYLIMAIGATGKPRKSDSLGNSLDTVAREDHNLTQQTPDFDSNKFANMCFGWAWTLVAKANVDMDLYTVQCFLLMTFFLISKGSQNEAFECMKRATEAASTIGMQEDADWCVPCELVEAEQRALRCMRILKLYTAASIGRPAAAVDRRFYNEHYLTAIVPVQDGNMMDVVMTKISLVYEQILTHQHQIPGKLDISFVRNISQHLRACASELLCLGNDACMIGNMDGGQGALQQLIRKSHIYNAYYTSIILITRPYLRLLTEKPDFSAWSSIRLEDTSYNDNLLPTVVTLAEACIEYALHIISTFTVLFRHPDVPRNLFLATNSTFMAATVLALGNQAGYDRKFPLINGLDQALAILAHQSSSDGPAALFEIITAVLKENALLSTLKREKDRDAKRTMSFQAIFGELVL